MKWATLVYILINPLIFWVGFDARDVQQVCFQLTSVLLIAYGMASPSRVVKVSKLNILVAVMLAAFTLAWLRTTCGWVIALNCFLGVSVYFTLIRTLKMEDIKFVFNGFLYLVLLSVIVLACQLIGWDPRGVILAGTNTPPPESLFFQRSAMGMFFANSLPIIATTMSVYITPFIFIPMIWSQSTAAFLGASAGLLFFLWFRKRIMFWIMLGTLILGGIFVGSKPSTLHESMIGMKLRIPMWKSTIQYILQKPIGYGLDSFAIPQDGQIARYNYNYNGKYDCAEYERQGDNLIPANDKSAKYLHEAVSIPGFNGKIGNMTLADHPHNEYLFLGYEVGLHAWIILGFIFYFIWQRFYKSKRTAITCASMAVLISFAMESVFQFPFHLSRIGSFLPFIMSAFYISTEE